MEHLKMAGYWSGSNCQKLCLIINRQTYVECNKNLILVLVSFFAKIDALGNDEKRKELVKQASAVQKCHTILVWQSCPTMIDRGAFWEEKCNLRSFILLRKIFENIILKIFAKLRGFLAGAARVRWRWRELWSFQRRNHCDSLAKKIKNFYKKNHKLDFLICVNIVEKFIRL